MEARDLVERRYGTAVVGGYGAAGVADEEGPVEATEHIGGHHSWILFFLDSGRCGAVDVPVGVCGNIVGGVGSHRLVCWAIDEAIGVVIDVAVLARVVVGLVAVGQWVATEQRRGKMNGFALWREQVVCNILDKDSLALHFGGWWVSICLRMIGETGSGRCSAERKSVGDKELTNISTVVPQTVHHGPVGGL